MREAESVWGAWMRQNDALVQRFVVFFWVLFFGDSFFLGVGGGGGERKSLKVLDGWMDGWMANLMVF